MERHPKSTVAHPHPMDRSGGSGGARRAVVNHFRRLFFFAAFSAESLYLSSLARVPVGFGGVVTDEARSESLHPTMPPRPLRTRVRSTLRREQSWFDMAALRMNIEDLRAIRAGKTRRRAAGSNEKIGPIPGSLRHSLRRHRCLDIAR